MTQRHPPPINSYTIQSEVNPQINQVNSWRATTLNSGRSMAEESRPLNGRHIHLRGSCAKQCIQGFDGYLLTVCPSLFKVIFVHLTRFIVHNKRVF